MDRADDKYIADLTTQVTELRAVNAELGRALAAADTGTPLRSSITAALSLSRIRDAEQAAAAARAERELAMTERDGAVAEREGAVAERDRAVGALQEVRSALAEQAAEASRLSDALAAASTATELALAERDLARATLESAWDELEHLRTMLSRRSVRTAQRVASAASPLFDRARRLRSRAASE